MRLLEKINNNQVYTIAEMSANHDGNLDKAIKLVHAVKETGADCFKIQTYTADSLTLDCNNDYFTLKDGLWKGYNLYKLYEQAAMPYDWQAKIKQECDKLGLDFLSTPFDEDSADFLESIGVEAYKIASFELIHLPLIEYVAKKGKPMIVSCGMGTEAEIGEAVDIMLNAGLPKEKIVLLKCTSEYPATYTDMNLATITDMKQKFGIHIGLSDHSMGCVTPVVAVAQGAVVIEKHICMNRSDGGVDSAFSMESHEFAEMVTAVKQAKQTIGTVKYASQDGEATSFSVRRSIFASADIKKGDVFSKENIKVVRPGHGLKPKHMKDLVGAAAKRDISFGMPIESRDL